MKIKHEKLANCKAYLEQPGEKHYTASVVDGWMSVEHWWNDTDRGN
jgi:hypothetical protein